MGSQQPIQASLQVDLDFSRIQEKARQADQLADQAERRADMARQRAGAVVRDLEQEEARFSRIANRFQNKVIESPLKKIGKIGIALAASEWIGASDFGDGSGPSYLGQVGKAALFGLAAGPEGAVIAAIGASVNWLIDEHQRNIREAQEIRKMVLQERDERAKDRRDLQEKVEALAIERASQKAIDAFNIESGFRDLDYRTFLLMSE